MQFCYTFCLLKRIPYVDVFVIATGFVLRAIAGATALTVRISPWLLLCTFLLALFLALCKRRHAKKILLEDAGEQHREALAGYDRYLLDMQIASRPRPRWSVMRCIRFRRDRAPLRYEPARADDSVCGVRDFPLSGIGVSA